MSAVGSSPDSLRDQITEAGRRIGAAARHQEAERAQRGVTVDDTVSYFEILGRGVALVGGAAGEIT
jgi:hypothetical protein